MTGYIRKKDLMEYCSNSKDRTIDLNDIARFPICNVAPIRVPPPNYLDEGCGFCDEYEGEPQGSMEVRDFKITCIRLGRTFVLEARNWSGGFNLVIDYCPFCGRRLTLPIDGGKEKTNED